MKINILVACALMAGSVVHAQHVPDQLNYQAILTDQQGVPSALSTNTVNFRIYDEAEGGNLIWGETHSVTTSARGLFSVILGTGTTLDENMHVANLRAAFASGTLVEQRYIELQAINANGTPQSIILPRQRFLTAPYAFQANDSQTALAGFRVSGALYAQNEGAQVGTLIMTNLNSSITAAGDFVVDGYGKTGVSSTFNGTSAVQSTASDALRAQGDLQVNAPWSIAGTGSFYGAVSATDPTFNKGIRVKGGMRALGAYTQLVSGVTKTYSNNATGDGFALVYLKTAGWGNDASLVVSVNGVSKVELQHQPYSAGAYHAMHFETTACVPIAKGEAWSVGFSSSGSHSDSTFDLYWIPFGY
ncbi:MAG: hypothetical protein EOM20_02755 [Spartobacteria bacterium]|nr:hypothetical protein [Spartobacteria bacterium]